MITGQEFAAIKAGIEIVTAAKKLYSSPAKRDVKLYRHLSEALRVLYFPPNGVLRFLEAIARGEKIDEERLKVSLTEFNDREWEVEAALKAVDFDTLQNELSITIETSQALIGVQYGKVSLRRDIQNEINYYGQRGVKFDRERVRNLVAGIRALNKSIAELEKIINSNAR